MPTERECRERERAAYVQGWTMKAWLVSTDDPATMAAEFADREYPDPPGYPVADSEIPAHLPQTVTVVQPRIDYADLEQFDKLAAPLPHEAIAGVYGRCRWCGFWIYPAGMADLCPARKEAKT